ncbi:MAG: hypothetical protein LBL72_06985 [Candidatus Accumulibacter sp.]|jgi:hypothetical protein|nr:hypothetical protein [Accumulibacter sp.]
MPNTSLARSASHFRYQVSEDRGQKTDQLPAASPPEMINEIPIGFLLIPDS